MNTINGSTILKMGVTMHKAFSTVLLLVSSLLVLSSCTGSVFTFGTDELRWTEFTWIEYNTGNEMIEKAAILIPITIEGHEAGTLWMQLDTGVYNSMFYELPFKHVDKDAYRETTASDGKTQIATFSGTIGDLTIKHAPMVIKPDYGDVMDKLEGDVILGTIGLDFFMGKLLVLDFPKSRLAVLNPGAEALPVVSQADFIPAFLEKGWLMVQAKAGETTLKLMFDTGSSPFPLWVQRPLWQQLTDRDPTDATLQRMTGPSWGNMITFVRAPMKGHLKLGNYAVSQPDVCYADGDVSALFAGLEGILGNALFFNHTVILDLKNMRFGIAKAP